MSSPITASGFSAIFDLFDLDGTNGFILNGIDSADNSGTSVSSAGDINGDGFDDIIIGAGNAGPNGNSGAGESYVVFGSDTGFAPVFDLSSLDGTNGFVLNGIDANDFSGSAVSRAGDINGDGLDDIIIGASNADQNGNSAAGESYVVFGSSTGFAPSFDLSSLDGTNGFTLNGIDAGDQSGKTVAAAGDINGDGFDDIIIGAVNADPNGNGYAGETYVVFGSGAGFDPALDLSTLDGTNGFVLNGIDANDYSSFSISSAGDINGDGFDDIIIGAYRADPNGNAYAGESYVVFGSGTGFAPALDLSSLDGTNGFTVNGIDGSDYSGSSVSSAGDINGDGFDDIVIGANYAAPNGNSGAGESYVVFGSDAGFAATLDPASLDGTNGFVINGVDSFDSSGTAVSSAGDVNGDGFDDIIIGAYAASPNGNSVAGESYVVFGSATGFAASFDLSSLDGENGFVINGIDSLDLSGGAVSAAGDINGDGFDDIIIGAEYASPNGAERAGESYVIFGQAPTEAATRVGSDIDQTIQGGAFNDDLSGLGGMDTLIGAAGDDTLLGGNGDDTLIGGANDDLLNGGAGADAIDGGDGIDTASYVGAAGRMILDLQNSAISFGDAVGDTYTNVEVFEGSRFNDQLRGDSADNTFFGGTFSDRLFGRAGDDTLNGEGGADAIYGNSGVDTMTGGDDTLRDRFIYFNSSESGVGTGNRDIITDFTSGEDRIEISRFDANSVGGGGNDVFVFIEEVAFSNTAGELRFEQDIANGITVVQADFDGDGAADFEIELTGLTTLDATDFLL